MTKFHFQSRAAARQLRIDPTCELADACAEAGAPVELFRSADEGFVLDLAREGMTEDQGAVYVRGRLTILVPRGSPLALPAHVAQLRCLDLARQ